VIDAAADEGAAMTVSVAAVDLGATSGRVMAGRVGPDELSLHQVARFPNGPVSRRDGLHWDFVALRGHIFDGLREAGRYAAENGAAITSIGIDSWAVDYGLLRGGALTAEPFHYRDERTAAGVAAVHGVMPHEALYARNGLQFLPFNTVYQLAADRLAGRLSGPNAADEMLLIPDLVASHLTGSARAERTNASTTGLFTVNGEWDWELIDVLELPRTLFAELIGPGETVGELTAQSVAALGFSAPVTAVASHDTASAVVATPMAGDGAAYVSCGTWGLVGLEATAPIVTAESRSANFTNEGGAFGTTRFLRNVMGLWLLNESVATWRSRGISVDLPALLAAAAADIGPVTIFDVDDPRFSAPGDMPARIETYCQEQGLATPAGPVQMVRSIVESLAVAFARTAHRAAELAGRQIDVIHVVGGGALNALLCQRIADRSGLPVVAGPVEATALGNVLMQGYGAGAVSGDLASMRELVARRTTLTRYTPAAVRP
jgi:rhamnulokinase